MRDIKYFFEQKVLNFLLPVTDRWLIHHQATSAGHFETDHCHLRTMVKLELLLQIVLEVIMQFEREYRV